MTEVVLPSGSKLKITLAPFSDSNALYKAILSEAKGVALNPNEEIGPNLFKDIFCTLMSSEKIDAALWKCMSRATYNDVRVTPDTFENESARVDYISVCVEVARVNVLPFLKNLTQLYSAVYQTIEKIQA